MKCIYFWPLAAHVIGTLAIGFGWVIPRSCIEGVNALTVGFAVSVVSTCIVYWAGIRQAVRGRP